MNPGRNGSAPGTWENGVLVIQQPHVLEDLALLFLIEANGGD